MDPNIVHMNLINFTSHGASYSRFPVPSSLRVTGLWRDPFKSLIKPYENAERIIVTQTY